MTLLFDFPFIALDPDGERLRCEARVTQPTPLASGYRIDVRLEGRPDFSTTVEGSDRMQAIQAAVDAMRTALDDTAGWRFEDEYGEPLDFGYRPPAA